MLDIDIETKKSKPVKKCLEKDRSGDATRPIALFTDRELLWWELSSVLFCFSSKIQD